MASPSSPSHSPSLSLSNSISLGPPPQPTTKQQRRMTSPALQPPAPLNLPEPVTDRSPHRRPPSPLRQAVTYDSRTGQFSDTDDGSMRDGGVSDADPDDGSMLDRPWARRPQSPSPSLTQFASNVAQRVGNLVGNNPNNVTPSNGPGQRKQPPPLPSDAELEAEAAQEREKSRREAERILAREKGERAALEERVMALLGNTKTSPDQLPPPPPKSSNVNAGGGSPTSSTSSLKENRGWFAAVKDKLTPTKEALTPAQQVIQEAKLKEKEKKKQKEWPAKGSDRSNDPMLQALQSSPITPPRRPAGLGSDFSTSPTPLVRPIARTQANLNMTPSPMRSIGSQEGPPFYAQFTPDGTLDVPSTLLTVARRFEKLEKWTVTHVRALEDRMGDVERWLVDKEKEKEFDKDKDKEPKERRDPFSTPEKGESGAKESLNEIKDELAELQGRVGELGREMAKFATASPNLSHAPTRSVASVTTVPSQQTPVAGRSLPLVPITPVFTGNRQSSMATPVRSNQTSPPPSSVTSVSSRTRLPYPTGDYTSPPGSFMPSQGASPANSPPPSLNGNSRQRPLSIAGLPSANAFGALSNSISAPSGLPARAASPASIASSTHSIPPIPPSKSEPLPEPIDPQFTPPTQATAVFQREVVQIKRQSISPTPNRKRYTVALGAPVAPPASDSEADDEGERLFSRAAYNASPVSTPSFVAADDSTDQSDADDEGHRGHFRDETIGKSAARMVAASGEPEDDGGSGNSPYSNSRIRAQSTADLSLTKEGKLATNGGKSIAPLRPRLRTRSTDRFSPRESPTKTNFIDPLIARRQEKETIQTPKTPTYTRSGNKVPVRQLAAFFDRDK